MRPSSEFKHKGLPVKSVNILRLISELEGSYQLLHYMGFDDDRDLVNELKQKYYKLYFKLNKEEKNNPP